MYSFDHDIGSFVAIGTGTVSDDGLLIRSDPGVGVLKAGWHCGGNPSASGDTCSCQIDDVLSLGDVMPLDDRAFTSQDAVEYFLQGTGNWTRPSPAPKPKFPIKTKSCVLGVRG
jgi:hypothetical protein